ncbi:hypothetical protein J9B83_15120 [Marinomonas sp. A79]|uniref:ParB/Sulfiredoxin domain-containing protein n=1 Tax=Marinomonas vulgaris TaxID=2823372 RepID=A0ABS5HFA4_9GAMM|nr:hypothetical protein [Marinomonas vulgaris]MBR7890237.1 hypothetical protein [Marinomonas vulgaris]
MDNFRSRSRGLHTASGNGLSSLKDNKSTFIDQITGNKYTFKTSDVSIASSELDIKTEVSPFNPREISKIDLENLSLYRNLTEFQALSDPAIGYTLPESDTIFIANGATRRACCIDIYNKLNIDIKYNIHVIQLDKDSMWLVLQEIRKSDSNQKFTFTEQSINALSFYEMYAAAEPNASVKSIIENYNLTGASSLSQGRFSLMIPFAILYSEINEFLVDIDSRKLSAKFAKSVVDFIEKEAGKKITIRKTVKDDTTPKGYSFVALDNIKSTIINEFKNELSSLKTLLSSLPSLDVKTIDDALQVKNNSAIDAAVQNDSTNSFAISEQACTVNFSFTREDYSESQMEKIKEIFNEHADLFEDLKKKLDQIV